MDERACWETRFFLLSVYRGDATAKAGDGAERPSFERNEKKITRSARAAGEWRENGERRRVRERERERNNARTRKRKREKKNSAYTQTHIHTHVHIVYSEFCV